MDHAIFEQSKLVPGTHVVTMVTSASATEEPVAVAFGDLFAGSGWFRAATTSG
jgi:hypothetical protein